MVTAVQQIEAAFNVIEAMRATKYLQHFKVAIIGEFAVRMHDPFRITRDVDFFVKLDCDHVAHINNQVDKENAPIKRTIQENQAGDGDLIAPIAEGPTGLSSFIKQRLIKHGGTGFRQDGLAFQAKVNNSEGAHSERSGWMLTLRPADE